MFAIRCLGALWLLFIMLPALVNPIANPPPRRKPLKDDPQSSNSNSEDPPEGACPQEDPPVFADQESQFITIDVVVDPELDGGEQEVWSGHFTITLNALHLVPPGKDGVVIFHRPSNQRYTPQYTTFMRRVPRAKGQGYNEDNYEIGIDSVPQILHGRNGGLFHWPGRFPRFRMTVEQETIDGIPQPWWTVSWSNLRALCKSIFYVPDKIRGCGSYP